MKQNLTIFCCFHSLKITNMKFPVAIAETQANFCDRTAKAAPSTYSLSTLLMNERS